MSERATRFAVSYALLRAAADVADHWVQSDYCAQVKGATDDATVTVVDEVTDAKTVHGTADGTRACVWHCLTYTATQGVVLVAGSRAVGVRLRPGAVAAALAVSGITHYIADRRVPNGVLQRLSTRLGKGRFYRLADHGMNGAYALDQAWHHGCETLAAVVASAK
ncbi:hypothetical protein [Streptomyces litchfieldiae]|uniref:Uncharacterized protein n=1 Tax=Streptomyces litchfieldiae TaxID=3075543 RepID=A0ABU2N0V8_9ACTN|nr:hypothetical protein [Streptomyces sp. DSM 44938]MDT0347538.1 hypothetical protein [Streptomyces sp. DSM 44938]